MLDGIPSVRFIQHHPILALSYSPDELGADEGMMHKIKLGGIKIFEGRACLDTRCRSAGGVLPEICARLAADRINLTLLTHIADSGQGQCLTALCTERTDSFSSYFLLKVNQERGAKVCLQSDTNILSIFPYDQRLDVTGALVKLLARVGVRPLGLASSPSALSVLIQAADTGRVIDGLFEPFEFPAYRSPFDWHAAYQGREQVLKEIICSYQEQRIKVYNVLEQLDVDLWSAVIPMSRMEALGDAFAGLHAEGMKMPFLVAQSGGDESLFLTFCLPSERYEEAMQGFTEHLPRLEPERLGPVAAFSMHGPHFGDRYGITKALVGALQDASITPLALCCAVSSITVVVRAEELEWAIRSLHTRFDIPG